MACGSHGQRHIVRSNVLHHRRRANNRVKIIRHIIQGNYSRALRTTIQRFNGKLPGLTTRTDLMEHETQRVRGYG